MSWTCRRNGKPTSLGCFDLETEAAKAYDKMMLWCELHQNLGMKGGITNFDASEYERDLEHLQNISQVRLRQPALSAGGRCGGLLRATACPCMISHCTCTCRLIP